MKSKIANLNVNLMLSFIVFSMLLNSMSVIILQLSQNQQYSYTGLGLLEFFKDIPIALVSVFLVDFIKKRSYLKPISLLVSSKDAIPLVSRASVNQLNFMDKYLPGPYTFILKKSKIVPRHLTSGSANVGIRVPESEIACNLAKLFPITTTSANLSSEDTLDTPEEILKQLGCEVDLVIDVGPLKSKNPSTIIDLTAEEPIFVKR